MELGKEERAKAVDLLERFTLRTERIFVAMLLLPDMLKLGYPAEKGLEVCRRGLGYTEDYYRLQAARLLSEIAERNEVKEDDLRAMIRDREIGVRVYGARAFWLRKSNATDVIPILVDALNREKYQSYYYPEIQSAALDLLGRIGPEDKAAIQDLEKLKNDPDPAIAKAAAEVLKNIEM
jgi:HEAT repeat protein